MRVLQFSLLAFCLAARAFAADAVTTARGEAADLVRQWWADGTAAGNAGDYYDNRDRGHRFLNLKLFPQLSLIKYATNEIAARQDYGSARNVRTNVIIGNSSTSARAVEGGSNPRTLYVRAQGVALLYHQYTRNNLFAYPEHQDHDPGHNGSPGYGDLYPLNTPYLYISQGSSGSELAFVEATALTLAAFRPDVKQALIKKGLLMPTIQMLLRRSYSLAPESADYLTGNAHPTVFESAKIDAARMVRGAHAITLDTLPPMVQMRVIDEFEPRARVDFFDVAPSEKLADTPCAIGRVFRGVQRARRMIVSAETSFDPNLRPLSWRWAVLRGDTNRITITPLNERGSRVEIEVAYHQRRPVQPGSEIESNRIDIGCFVHNGAFFSPPGFISYFFLDSEARVYNQAGRLMEVTYGLGESQVRVSDWKKFFALLREDPLRSDFLQNRIPADDWESILNAADEYARLSAARVAAQQQEDAARKAATSASGDAAADAKAALKAQTSQRAAAEKAVANHLAPIETMVEALFTSWKTNFEAKADFERIYKSAARPRRDEYDRAKKLLAEYGPLQPASAFEQMLKERIHATAIASLLFPGAVENKFVQNYVDPNLTAKKDWRDVYRYDPAGALLGWTRYTPGLKPAEFNPAGFLVEGSRIKSVRYDLRPDASKRAMQMQWTRSN